MPASLLHAVIYFGTLLLFGVWGVLFNLVCAVALLWPRSPAIEHRFQALIHRQLRALLWWLQRAGVITLEYRGWEQLRTERVVMVANHPGLLDAFFLLAQVPRGFCIFKPSIRRNPVLGAAALRAGYVANDTGIHLVRGGLEKIAQGSSLIVFPEGTRTPLGAPVGRFRAGFALIARHARVPLQLVRITSERGLLAKAMPWWEMPQLPVRIVVEAGPVLDPASAPSTAALVTNVEAWFRSSPAIVVSPELAGGVGRSLTAS